MQRVSWHQYFMAQSHLLALRSTCTRLMVGATVVLDKRIIAGGYNGSVSGSVHCIDEGCYIIDGHCVRTVHAEANALLQCAKFGARTDGADVYVTHFPCLPCCKLLIQAGIKSVYYAEDYRNHLYAVQLFEEAGVHVEKIPLTGIEIDTNPEGKNQLINDLLKALQQSTVDEDTFRQLEDRFKSLDK